MEYKFENHRLRATRVRTIKDIQANLFELKRGIEDLTSTSAGSGWSTDIAKEAFAMDKLKEFAEHAKLNGNYLTDELIVKIENIIGEYKNVIRKMSIAKKEEKQWKFSDKYLHTWSDTESYFSIELEAVYQELESEFRKVIVLI